VRCSLYTTTEAKASSSRVAQDDKLHMRQPPCWKTWMYLGVWKTAMTGKRVTRKWMAIHSHRNSQLHETNCRWVCKSNFQFPQNTTRISNFPASHHHTMALFFPVCLCFPLSFSSQHRQEYRSQIPPRFPWTPAVPPPPPPSRKIPQGKDTARTSFLPRTRTCDII